MKIIDDKVLFLDLWTKIANRKIKLRDKHENTTINCTFDVYECYNNNEDTFFYLIKDVNNEEMNFGYIDINMRNKVINNIDTIIGYAIKLINRKVCFNPENVNQLINLLWFSYYSF